MPRDLNYVKALAMSYEFDGTDLVFDDGVRYSIREAATLARGRLSDDDLQAIHLVKKLIDGEVLDQPGAFNQAMYSAPASAFVSDGKVASVSLDDIAAQLGAPPIFRKE